MHDNPGEYGEVVEVKCPDLRLKMAVHEKGEFVSASLRERGWYSQRDYTLFRALLKPGDSYIDVGAHIGLYALYVAHVVGPKGKVVALEPEPKNYELLRENIRLNDFNNVETLQAAAGAREGRSKLFLSPQNSGDHYLSSVSGGRESVGVPVTTLDRVVSRFDLKPRLIKIDVQGAEAQVLAGARETLKNKPVVILEFSPGLMGRIGDSPFEFFAFVEKGNYLPYLIHGDFDTGPLLEPLTVQALLDFTQQNRQTDVGWDVLLVSQEQRSQLQPLFLSL